MERVRTRLAAGRAAVPVLIAAAISSGCDAVHFARIDIGPYGEEASAVSPLSVGERDRCVQTFAEMARDLDLECHETEYPIIRDSYDPRIYRLTECRRSDDSTDVQLAVGDHHVSVELHKISGSLEPAFFRQCRTTLSERFRQEFGNERVTVRYPYEWGSNKR